MDSEDEGTAADKSVKQTEEDKGSHDASMSKTKQEAVNSSAGGKKDDSSSKPSSKPSSCSSSSSSSLLSSLSKKVTVNKDAPLVDDDGNPVSKNQLKKRRRWEKMMEKKRRRKLQEREAKLARAKLENRDLERERRDLEERTKSGEGRKRREEKFQSRLQSARDNFRVCIDCGYEDQMSDKEINSLALQIRYCYSRNKNSPAPHYLSVSSLDGKTLEILGGVCGFPDQWTPRGFSFSSQSLEVLHSDHFDRLVYLTSDSDNVVDTLDNAKIYVIGGIVDRNRLKGAAKNRAECLGIPTAKLPIDEHLTLFTTKVLTCNHVFDIMLQTHENHGDWKQSLMSVLPLRKKAIAVENNDGSREGAQIEDQPEASVSVKEGILTSTGSTISSSQSRDGDSKST